MALRQGRSNYPGKQMVVVTRDPPKKNNIKTEKNGVHHNVEKTKTKNKNEKNGTICNNNFRQSRSTSHR